MTSFGHDQPCRKGFIMPVLPLSAVPHLPIGDKIAGILNGTLAAATSPPGRGLGQKFSSFLKTQSPQIRGHPVLTTTSHRLPQIIFFNNRAIFFPGREFFESNTKAGSSTFYQHPVTDGVGMECGGWGVRNHRR